MHCLPHVHLSEEYVALQIILDAACSKIPFPRGIQLWIPYYKSPATYTRISTLFFQSINTRSFIGKSGGINICVLVCALRKA